MKIKKNVFFIILLFIILPIVSQVSVFALQQEKFAKTDLPASISEHENNAKPEPAQNPAQSQPQQVQKMTMSYWVILIFLFIGVPLLGVFGGILWTVKLCKKFKQDL